MDMDLSSSLMEIAGLLDDDEDGGSVSTRNAVCVEGSRIKAQEHEEHREYSGNRHHGDRVDSAPFRFRVLTTQCA
jgi:hypothetical protein